MSYVNCEAVDFSYSGSRPVLASVTFDVAPGQICGLVGASGSGKSTLLKLLAGLLPGAGEQHFSGRISINGQTPKDARERGKLGFVFQDMKLLPFLSVRQNIAWSLNGRRGHSSPKDIQQEVDRVLSLVGLTGYADHWPKALSGGMKARVAIGRAIIGEPSLLLLDEALSSLDVGWRLALHRELRRLRDELGLTIVMISHDLDEISTIADRVVVLSSAGRVARVLEGADGSHQRAREMQNLVLADHPAREMGG